jgi:Tfp pilus assembly protein PilN
MARAGFWLNLVGAVLVTVLAYFLAPAVLALEPPAAPRLVPSP